MSKFAQTFVEAAVAGTAELEEIHDWIDHWNNWGFGITMSMSDALGMSHEEYAMWVMDPSCLRGIIDAHRR